MTLSHMARLARRNEMRRRVEAGEDRHEVARDLGVTVELTYRVCPGKRSRPKDFRPKKSAVGWLNWSCPRWTAWR